MHENKNSHDCTCIIYALFNAVQEKCFKAMSFLWTYLMKIEIYYLKKQIFSASFFTLSILLNHDIKLFC